MLLRLFLDQTRRERLKPALYVRLKKHKIFNICPGRIDESSENSFETPKRCLSCSIIHETHFFPNWNKEKTFFEKNFGFLSFGKCRIMPKTVKGDTTRSSGFISIHCCRILKKLGGDLFETFSKVSQGRKKSRGTL